MFLTVKTKISQANFLNFDFPLTRLVQYPKISDGNWATSYIKGSVQLKNIIKIRGALPLDNNNGGLPELIINPKNVNMWKYMKTPCKY
jgi:hypothetical protein